MLSIQKVDILSFTKGIIAHQCNCRGVMNGGLAKQVRLKYPLVYEEYMKACRAKEFVLGCIQPIQINKYLYVVNMAGQDGFGRDKVYTDMEALYKCLTQLNKFSESNNLPIYLPYGLGCGLGGGDWNSVYTLIEDTCPNAVLCKLD